MKLNHPIVYTWIILWLMVASFTLSCTRAKPPQKLVVLTFDDAVRSHLEYVAPLLKEKGFGATFFVCDLWMRDTANFLQWDEVGELHRMGFELANHTWNHKPLLQEADFADMEENLGKVDSALQAHGVPRPVTFGYPGNHYAPGAVQKIRELGYQYARRGMQPEIPYGKISHGPLYDPSINHPLVIPTTADAYPEWTLDYFKTVVDRATPGKAVILQFHGVPDVAHPWVHTDPQLFAQFMDYLEESGAKVIAMKDLANYLDVQEVDDPALNYTAGVPGFYNPCPESGDVWILAGQSNMQGAGRTPDTLTHSHIWMMNLDDRWSIARAPLHRIYESRAPAHALAWHELFGHPDSSQASTLELFGQKAILSRAKPIGGTGPGLYFARSLFEQTGRAVGLIPCALGGSKIDQWAPAGLEQGDSTLYGAMIGRIRQTDPKQIRGMLWYQGESEAMLAESDSYEKKFLDFVDGLRRDTELPELPVLMVQIGRMNIMDPEQGRSWEAMREVQRNLISKRKQLYFTTAIDLAYDDVVHLSTESNRILGERLAQIALSHVYDMPGYGKQIQLESLELITDQNTGSPCLKLDFRGVSGSLRASGKPSSFQLRFGDDTRIYEVVSRVWLDPVYPSSVFLNLSKLPAEPAQLYGGAGIHPSMNITDSLNMPLPAFGPIHIDFEMLKAQTMYF